MNLFLALVSLFAGDTVLVLEPSATEVHWTLETVLHTVHGTFQLKSGIVHFDPATGKASGRLVVNAASGESGNESRDARMHKSILESARFPDIVFTPDHEDGAIPAQGSTTIQVHGTFQLRGVDHELTIPVQIAVDPGQVSASARFVVPYIRWGLKNPSTFVLRVSDHVDIELHSVGHISNGGSR